MNRYGITVTHKPTGLSVTCTGFRSLAQNKAEAIKLLKNRLIAKEKGMDKLSLIRTFDTDGPVNWIKDHRTGSKFDSASEIFESMDISEVIENSIREDSK